METLKNYVDWKLAHSDKTATAEGYPLIMENCKINKRMKQLQVYGDCMQRLGSKNLLPYPYYRTTATINGVTFTDNGDGSITVNGTATADAVFYLYTNNTTLIPGIKRGDTVTGTLYSDQEWDASVEKLMVVLNYHNAATTMKDGVILNSSLRVRTFAITDDWYGMGFYILVSKGGIVDNITLRVQIELGTTSTEYEPYVLSPSPDYPSEIETVGDLTTKNLFDMETILPEQGWIKQDDGSYYVESAATSYQQVLWENTENYSGQLKILYQFKYLKGSSESPVGSFIQIKYTDGTSQAVYLNTGKFDADTWYVPTDSRTITDSSKTVSQIIWAYGTGGNSTWVKDIMITKDTTATEYEPYHKYKIPIVVRGKNLFDKDHALVFNGYFSGTTIANYNPTPSGMAILCINCKPNTTYTASRQILSARFAIASSPNPPAAGAAMSVAKANHTGTSVTITTTAPDNYLYVWFYNKNLDPDYTYQELMNGIQIEEGVIATEYEPYSEPITQNIYLDEPLRKIEDYADCIDFKNQNVVRNIKEVTFNGTENWNYIDTDNIIYLPINNLASSTYCYSTHFLSYALKDNVSPYFRPVSGVLRLYQWSNNIVYSSADEFKAFLQEQSAAVTPLILDYILATPTEEDISCQLPKTLAKTTIIEVDTSLPPSNMKGKYIKK